MPWDQELPSVQAALQSLSFYYQVERYSVAIYPAPSNIFAFFHPVSHVLVSGKLRCIQKKKLEDRGWRGRIPSCGFIIGTFPPRALLIHVDHA